MPATLDAPSPNVDIVPSGDGPAAVVPPASTQTITPPSTSVPDGNGKAPSEPFHNAFSDLDKIMEQKEKPAAKEKQKAKAPVEQPKQEVKDEPQDEPAENELKPDEQSKPEKKEEAPPKQAKELRVAYENLKAKQKTLETELAQLKAEKAKPKEDPEKKTLLEQVQDYQKRLKHFEEELKFASYERTEEYQQKYEKPFVDAYQMGRNKIAQLKITDTDGNSRQATPEDFDRIMRVPNDEEAAELAATMFGNKASVVLYHRERVQELNAARYRAVEDYRKNGSERFKKATEEATVRQTQMRQLWEQENSRIKDKYDWFKSKEGDEEGNKLLEQGYQLADLAFSEQLAQEPLEKQVSVHAALRNRAAAFGRLVHWNQQLTSRIAELEKELGAYKTSEPGEGEGQSRPGREPERDNWESALDAMAE